MSNTVAHEDGHVRQILLYNAVDFERTIAGQVTSADQLCPSPPCGWAFAHRGWTVLPNRPVGNRKYNRFLDLPPYNAVFDGCTVDVCIDWDNDAVPDDMDPNTRSPLDDVTDLEAFVYGAESCDPDELLGADWACPGRNANRSPEPGMGSCW